MAETVEELTPLKKKLDDFGSFLSKVPYLLLTAIVTLHIDDMPFLPARDFCTTWSAL